MAVGLGVERPAAAVVLRSPFTSLAAIGRIHYPFLPIGPFLKDRYPSIERVPALGSPLLVIAGARDRLIPPDDSRRLYEAAREPKRFVLIAGADHNDEALAAGDGLVRELRRFLGERGLAEPSGASAPQALPEAPARER